MKVYVQKDVKKTGKWWRYAEYFIVTDARSYHFKVAKNYLFLVSYSKTLNTDDLTEITVEDADEKARCFDEAVARIRDIEYGDENLDFIAVKVKKSDLKKKGFYIYYVKRNRFWYKVIATPATDNIEVGCMGVYLPGEIEDYDYIAVNDKDAETHMFDKALKEIKKFERTCINKLFWSEKQEEAEEKKDEVEAAEPDKEPESGIIIKKGNLECRLQLYSEKKGYVAELLKWEDPDHCVTVSFWDYDKANDMWDMKCVGNRFFDLLNNDGKNEVVDLCKAFQEALKVFPLNGDFHC